MKSDTRYRRAAGGICSIALLAVLFPVCMTAQELYSVGLTTGFGYNSHTPSLDILAGGSECGQFRSGDGRGGYAGIVGEIRLLPWLRGSARIAWSRLGGQLQETCDNGIIVPGENENEFVPLVRRHTRNVDLDYAMLELGTKILPLDNALFLSLGIGIGAPVFSSTFDQNEEILSPPGILFPGNVRSRSTGGGEISNTQLRTVLNAGVGYDLPLSEQFELSPEFTYAYHPGNTVAGENWSIDNIRTTLSLKWMFTPEPEAPPAPVPQPVPGIQKPVASIETGTGASIHILETFVTETFPILPYIFFDKNSSGFIQRYRLTDPGDTDRFTESGLPRKTLDIYYNILDIMGKRLRDNPEITVTLIGSTDDKGSEFGNAGLALQRSMRVKEYFTEVWEIEEKRIGVTTRTLPPIPTSQIYEEGDEENRRVDIVSGHGDLFRPVVHERFSEFEISPPTMVLQLNAVSTSPLSAWRMEVEREGSPVKLFKGEGSPPDSVSWTLDEDLAAELENRERFEARLTITDSKGETGTSAISIPVSKTQNAYEIGRLSLIVFDFDKSEILPHNESMIERFVSHAIKTTSSVMITGSTDRLGESEHNLELSEARAENVRAILLSNKPEYKSLKSQGIGEAPYLYDNSLPEGRFYCRTVSVEVKTPRE